MTSSHYSSETKDKKWVIHELPYIPSQISISDLSESGNIASDEEFLQIKKKIDSLQGDSKTDRRYRKTELGASKESKGKHGIIHLVKQNKYIALHKGLKHEPIMDADVYSHVLGRGGFGVVKIGQDQHGKFYAVKIVEQSIVEEYDYLQQAGLAIAKIQRQSPTKGKQDNIVMEIAPGIELYNFIKNYSDRITIKPICFIEIALNMLGIVENLIKKKILHRDIKIENFMIDLVSEKVTLIDFGLAATLPDCNYLINDNIVGNLDFLSPEILQDNCYSEKSEVYALGMALGDLFQLSNYHYSKNKNSEELIDPKKMFAQTSIYFVNNTTIPCKKMRLEILNFLGKMISLNLADRPDINACIIFFKTIENELLRNSSVEVGILNMQEWIASENDMRTREELIKQLKKFEKVWFIDTRSQFIPLDYIKLRKEFETHFLRLGNKIFFQPNGNEKEILHDIANYCKQWDQKRKYIISHVTNKKVEISPIVKLGYFSKPIDVSDEKIPDVQCLRPA